MNETKREILNNFLHQMRIACDGEEESFTSNCKIENGLVKYQINLTIKEDSE